MKNPSSYLRKILFYAASFFKTSAIFLVDVPLVRNTWPTSNKKRLEKHDLSICYQRGAHCGGFLLRNLRFHLNSYETALLLEIKFRIAFPGKAACDVHSL
ncbi:hypothetical protein CEXT_659951 [Caerostris extrusa]|uniref:Secreted protein n=1 Tax=Caerostris extrusa TaxID=172846 RepID=A0AAV4MFL6_CAEEX|nr:hypothetical protein CEXT_659951 [Caerostris extrusa]